MMRFTDGWTKDLESKFISMSVKKISLNIHFMIENKTVLLLSFLISKISRSMSSYQLIRVVSDPRTLVISLIKYSITPFYT